MLTLSTIEDNVVVVSRGDDSTQNNDKERINGKRRNKAHSTKRVLVESAALPVSFYMAKYQFG